VADGHEGRHRSGAGRHESGRRRTEAAESTDETGPPTRPAGRHLKSVRRRAEPWWLLLVALLAAAVAVPVVIASSPTGHDVTTCGARSRVDVAVAPTLAGTVSRLVRTVVEPRLDCVRVVVSARPSAEVAAEVSRRSGQGLAGALPDIWLPDSRLWLDVARRTPIGVARLTGQFPTVARTPVVVAVRGDDVVREVHWSATAAPISSLLSRAGSQSVALTDPTADTAGLATLLEVGASAPSGDAPGVIADFARRVRAPGAGSPLDDVAAGRLSAAPSTERDVLAYDRDASGGATVAAYAGAGPATADVPLVVFASDAGGGPGTALDDAAQQLTRALLGGPGQAALRAAGFRDRSGRLAAMYQPVRPLTADGLPAATAPAGDQVRAVVDSWTRLGRRGRVIVVVDSSGSMAGTLPGDPSTTKSELAQRALTKVATSIAPDSDLGLWTFTASRGKDYRVLVPLGPADGRIGGTSRRQLLLRKIPQVRPVVGGGTGLYDTTLAAFRAASQNYAYGRLNAVLVITDGRNVDAGSIGLNGLLSSLRREFDGIKPVRIITCAYGADADLRVLRRIADVTGGANFQAPAAADVTPLLQKALADL
jgi:hypothetical protein